MTTSDFYSRKSTVDRGRSLASQEEECTADIAAEGWQLGKVFTDPELSASIFARKPRPDFDELVKYMESGECRILTMWEASRGSRDMEVWTHFLGVCIRKNILLRITSHHRTYDVRQRRDYRTMIDEGMDAHDESARTSERVKRTLRSLAAAGLPFGRVPYGYRRIYDGHGRYVETVEEPAQADIVREVARRIIAGESGSSITRDLNARGIPTPHGDGPWRVVQVSRLLRKPYYVGQRTHLGEYVTEGKWPKIIEQAEWDQCQMILASPAHRIQHSTTLRYALSGAARCTSCKALMRSTWVNTRDKPRRVFRCEGCKSVNIAAEAFETLVETLVRARMQVIDVADLFEDRPDGDAVRRAKAEIDRLEGIMSGHYDTAATGALSAAGLARMEHLLLPQIEAAVAEHQRLSVPPQFVDLASVDINEPWPLLDPAKLRTLVCAVADIWVMPARVMGRRFDRGRVTEVSRWRGSSETWADELARLNSSPPVLLDEA